MVTQLVGGCHCSGSPVTPAPAGVVDRDVMVVQGQAQFGDDLQGGGAAGGLGEHGQLVFDRAAGDVRAGQGGECGQWQVAGGQQQRHRGGLPEDGGVVGAV